MSARDELGHWLSEARVLLLPEDHGWRDYRIFGPPSEFIERQNLTSSAWIARSLWNDWRHAPALSANTGSLRQPEHFYGSRD